MRSEVFVPIAGTFAGLVTLASVGRVVRGDGRVGASDRALAHRTACALSRNG